MWWSYGGDHIAPELGFDQGFIHLILNADDYDRWYRSHPRNRATIAAGKPTWKDHDLYSFLRYAEYDATLREHPRIVSDTLGHASVAFTMQTYSHPDAQMARAIADSVERALGDE